MALDKGIVVVEFRKQTAGCLKRLDCKKAERSVVDHIHNVPGDGHLRKCVKSNNKIKGFESPAGIFSVSCSFEDPNRPGFHEPDVPGQSSPRKMYSPFL